MIDRLLRPVSVIGVVTMKSHQIDPPIDPLVICGRHADVSRPEMLPEWRCIVARATALPGAAPQIFFARPVTFSSTRTNIPMNRMVPMASAAPDDPKETGRWAEFSED
ncbi:MAG: hypothetical protein WCJ64_03990 [Rhodospirillaceae bacterium]